VRRMLAFYLFLFLKKGRFLSSTQSRRDRPFGYECFCRKVQSPDLCTRCQTCHNLRYREGGGSIARYATSDKSMGKVLTTLTVTNRADQSAAKRGFIPTEQIRSITLDNVFVYLAATTLCLSVVAIAIPSKTNQQITIDLY